MSSAVKRWLIIIHVDELIYGGLQGDGFGLIHFPFALDAELVPEHTPTGAGLGLGLGEVRNVVAVGFNFSVYFVHSFPSKLPLTPSLTKEGG